MLLIQDKRLNWHYTDNITHMSSNHRYGQCVLPGAPEPTTRAVVETVSRNGKDASSSLCRLMSKATCYRHSDRIAGSATLSTGHNRATLASLMRVWHYNISTGSISIDQRTLRADVIASIIGKLYCNN